MIWAWQGLALILLIYAVFVAAILGVLYGKKGQQTDRDKEN